MFLSRVNMSDVTMDSPDGGDTVEDAAVVACVIALGFGNSHVPERGVLALCPIEERDLLVDNRNRVLERGTRASAAGLAVKENLALPRLVETRPEPRHRRFAAP